jgi:hypothetical protein
MMGEGWGQSLILESHSQICAWEVLLWIGWICLKVWDVVGLRGAC